MATRSESSIVSKCGLILDIISSARRPLSSRDIISQSGLAKSSAHRILTILVAEDLIEHDRANGIYRYGPRLTRWARGAWMPIDLQEHSANIMEKLANSTRMNSELSVLDGDSILYLRTVNPFPVNQPSHPGDRAPLHCTAAGKVFLAHMQQQQRDELMSGLRYEKMTEFTIRDPEQLIESLDVTRDKGYGMSLQEEYLPVIGVAAPIRDMHGEVIACLSLWGPIESVDKNKAETLAPTLIASADQISRLRGDT